VSYTTIKALWPGDRHEDYEILRNAWGSAPLVWDTFAQRYLQLESWILERNHDRLWSLWKRADIPAAHRAVLMLTFDRAYVLRKDYARMASDIRQFLADCPPDPNRANHWPRIAELLESNPDVPAIGIHCTSVSEDPFEGEWNEEKDTREPTNWDATFDLYSDLDALARQEAATT
jgi:hypothetical protein